jgi:hypothetical protein
MTHDAVFRIVDIAMQENGVSLKGANGLREGAESLVAKGQPQRYLAWNVVGESTFSITVALRS